MKIKYYNLRKLEPARPFTCKFTVVDLSTFALHVCRTEGGGLSGLITFLDMAVCYRSKLH